MTFEKWRMLGLRGGICGSGLDKAETQWDRYLLAYRGLSLFLGGGMLTDGGG